MALEYTSHGYRQQCQWLPLVLRQALPFSLDLPAGRALDLREASATEWWFRVVKWCIDPRCEGNWLNWSNTTLKVWWHACSRPPEKARSVSTDSDSEVIILNKNLKTRMRQLEFEIWIMNTPGDDINLKSHAGVPSILGTAPTWLISSMRELNCKSIVLASAGCRPNLLARPDLSMSFPFWDNTLNSGDYI
jgi:hypothetical protein